MLEYLIGNNPMREESLNNRFCHSVINNLEEAFIVNHVQLQNIAFFTQEVAKKFHNELRSKKPASTPNKTQHS